MIDLDVEEPGFEGVHLTGSFTQVVNHQVQSSGRQEVRVRAAELFSTCVTKKQEVKVKPHPYTWTVYYDLIHCLTHIPAAAPV